MPYKRNFQHCKYPNSRKRWGRKKVSFKKKISMYRARKNMYKLGRYLKPERKYHYVQGTASAVSTAGSIGSLNLIDEGSSPTERIGKTITVISITVKLLAAINASATNTWLRLIIGKHKQADGALPPFTDLLADTSALDACVSNLNILYGQDFRIYRDKVFHADQSNKTIHYSDYIKLNVPIKYNGTGNGITDVVSNNLFYMMVSNETTNTIPVTFYYTIRYYDA